MMVKMVSGTGQNDFNSLLIIMLGQYLDYLHCMKVWSFSG